MSRLETCAGSVWPDGASTGRCCATDCGAPAPYAVLRDEPDEVGPLLREHLRCIEHAAADRTDPALVAMKLHPEPSMTACPDCDGDGVVLDPDACGDPDHCSQGMTCPRCEGSGQVPA